MNLKFKKLYATLAVGLLTALSFTPTLNTEAALTAPTLWTFKYTNQDAPGFKLRNSTSVISTPTYVRTADLTYWNYTSTFTITSGLTATQTFNRSNTTWAFDAASGNYIPSAAAIGSDNTVGNIQKKVYLKFDNQTNKDYFVYFDGSSNTEAAAATWFGVNGLREGRQNIDYIINNTLSGQYLPSYTSIEFYYEYSVNSRYFDAWYLKDLGLSAAYQAGVDAGYIQGQDEANLLVTGFSAMVGILVNFVLMIVNLEVFGVSLMGIFAIIVLFTGIVWFLKLIRG